MDIKRLFIPVIAGKKANSSLLTGLVAYWKLDEESDGSGAVTRNDSVGSNHLTDNGTTAAVAGIVGNAAQFVTADGTKLQIASTSDLVIGDIDFTFALWVYPASNVDGKTLLQKKMAFSPYTTEYSLAQGVNRPAFNCGGVTLEPLFQPSINQWNLLIIYHDSVNDLMGVQLNNGVAQTKATGGAYPSATGTGAFAIGGATGNTTSSPEAAVDEVGFWKRLLSTDEKTTLYNSGGGMQYPF